ncbi:ABC transporter ATP-binding protein [Fusibacter sp. JL216-2]|uniref:ABC transporter ATP-binding protein n=1 Tax=Fusibacter sp. JL216-2 TaxID=3071453 RepID=UPI003D33231C
MALLQVKGLSKSYGRLKAVDNISFSVNEGEIIGLLGPNGAGKSTTISMISTLLKPESGEILYKGEDIVKNPKAIQKELGIVPQEIALYPTLSGYDNLKFWGQAYGLSGDKLKKRIDDVSQIIGIDERLKDRVENYSGGMKRRLNIGAALLHEPELLIMDEPTVGIDPQSRNHILDTVLKLNKTGMTIIYTSHYMEEVEYLCRNIHIMDMGHVIASGAQDELVDIVEGQRKVIFEFEKSTEALVEALGNIKGVDKVQQSGEAITLYTNNGKTLIQDALNIAMKAGVSVESVDVVKPNLETVFLHLTGKALRD